MSGKSPLLLIVLFSFLLAGSVHNNRGREANRAYLDGDYQLAEQRYREILERRPESPPVLFNLGNALARQGRSDESAEVFRKFRQLSEDPSAQSATDYNLGYVYANDGNLQTSLRYFRDAIVFDPTDEDALFNYELIRRRLLEKPPDPERDNQPEDQRQELQDRPFSPDQEYLPDQQSQASPSRTADQAPLSDRDMPQVGQPEITDQQLEHAEDIMNALEQIEKELIKDFKRAQHDAVEPHMKDW